MSLLQNLIPALNPLNRTAACADKTAASAAGVTATVKPRYEIKEAADAYAVTVFLPGVTKEGLEITAEDGHVRIVGRRAWQRPEAWSALYRETADAAYELVLTHDQAIDADKIVAELRDGVLRVSLAKHEAAKPRKIAVS